MSRIEFYLFKTSIASNREINVLTTHLNDLVLTGKWNFDLDDIDNIFCLYCKPQIKTQVERLFKVKGILIVELNYLESEIQNTEILQ